MDFLTDPESFFPLTNPVLKFLVILLIILAAPIMLHRVKVPHILGLIIAGAVIGPNGLNLLLRDSGIILSGTAGLLYIMFLAGLDINLNEFKKNSSKSFLFGFFTFSIPILLGILSSYYLLNFSLLTSVLIASMYASHTLIAYPILAKLGINKIRSVKITVGGTLITDTLALLVLAVIIGMTKGEVNNAFWIRLTVSIVIFFVIVMTLFPLIGRWFFKRYEDRSSQYVFVLAMVFLGAYLAELAGIEAIIGAFLTGLSLNRLIPSTSALMNRIEFVGNTIFIPFFLIGVGMLIDFRVFFKDLETIKVATVMTLVATSAKFIAAWVTQRLLKMNSDERNVIFGLSNAQAAATLAAVMVGYNVILGESASREPVRLLNESVLNGTIVMILITCTIATFAAQKGGKAISLNKIPDVDQADEEVEEKILISFNNPERIDELINLSAIIKSPGNTDGLFGLNIVNHELTDDDSEARKLLEKAAVSASAMDIQLQQLLRYDINIINGIAGAVREHNITDLVMGLHISTRLSESFLGKLTEGILAKCNVTTFIYKPTQPIGTIKRHVVIVPDHAEEVAGFPFWIARIWNLARHTGVLLVFYAGRSTLQVIREVQQKHPIKVEFEPFGNWNHLENILSGIKADDNLMIVLSRVGKISYHPAMAKVPDLLNQYLQSNSYILIYPMQFGVVNKNIINLQNPSLLEPMSRVGNYRSTVSPS